MSYTLDENEEPIYNDYWVYREQIKNFYIKNEIIEITDYDYKFDVTEEQNGRVVAYLVKNKDDNNFYDAYLMADGLIYPNSNAGDYFFKMRYLDVIDNIAGLDTSEVTSMYYMFSHAGEYSDVFTLDLSNFDTSNVTIMQGLFQKTGYNNSNFVLDVSNLDTSKAVDMSFMFSCTGYNSTILELDVSGLDTSNVTDMSAMFQCAGYSNPEFTLDVSNFDTSKVTDMSYMFLQAGYSSKIFTLDLSNFDTSNVTNMYAMLAAAGHDNENFTLNVSSFNTSKVTDMGSMFQQVGYNNKSFSLDLRNFDTSNVTSMYAMFADTGKYTTNFELNLSSFDTSKVTNMSHMFHNIGYFNENLVLNINHFDTSNLTDVSYMFFGAGGSSKALNVSITFSNPSTINYAEMFKYTAIESGSLIKVNYTKETEELVDKMVATKSESANVVKGNLIVDVDNLSIGDEIHISGEKFNVISQTDDTITMLAQYNIGVHYKQSTISNYVAFSDSNGWEYEPGPKEIDVQTWGRDTKTFLNNYVSYLQTELGDKTIRGDLITLTELKDLGCTIIDDYGITGSEDCLDLTYEFGLINGQLWWTRSASTFTDSSVWIVDSDGALVNYDYDSKRGGVRPVITISKDTLRNLNIL